MSLANRFGGVPLREKQEEQRKQKAIRDAGKKIKGKEAKKLKKMGVTKKDIKDYRFSGELSRKGSKVYDTKSDSRSSGTSTRSTSSSSFRSSGYSSVPSIPTNGYSSQINSLIGQIQQQQQAFQQNYEQNFETALSQFQRQADKQAQRYQKLMIAQRRAAAEAERQRQKAAEEAAIRSRTMMANQMRAASTSPQLKLGGDEPTPSMYGTAPFKRREVGMSAQGVVTGGINI